MENSPSNANFDMVLGIIGLSFEADEELGLLEKLEELKELEECMALVEFVVSEKSASELRTWGGSDALFGCPVNAVEFCLRVRLKAR